MSKYYKYLSIVTFLTILLIFYLLFFSEKIDTGREKNETNPNQHALNMTAKEKILEKNYVKNIGNITQNIEGIVNNIEKVNEETKTHIATSSFITINQSLDLLSKSLVPKRYKSYHLTLSRSLIYLSQFSKNGEEETLNNGIELFKEANQAFSVLNTSQ